MMDESLALAHSIQLEKLAREISLMKHRIFLLEEQVKELDDRIAGDVIIG